MGQADRLPKIKKIELTVKQMRPPEGSKPVGTTDAGDIIYEGPIFAGNPYFQDHTDPKNIDRGFTRTPVMDPITKEQKWKRNRTTGEAITPVFRNRRRTKIARFVMVDFGNGDAGPRPVPGLTADERKQREQAASQPEFDREMREFLSAAREEGLSPADVAKRLAALNVEEPKRKPGRPKKEEPVSVDG